MTKVAQLILLLCSVIATNGQQYRFTNYSLNEGLAQSQVFCIAESHQGYLFFGTRGGGLSRFNGLEFETFSTEQNLAGNYINALFEDKNQTLWVGTNLGLSAYQNQQIQRVSFFEGKSVSSICSAKNTLYVVADGQIFAKNDTVWQPIKCDVPILKIAHDPEGNLWAMATNRLLKLGAQKTESFPVNSIAECFAFSPDSTLWLGTYGNGVHILKDGKLVSLNTILNLENAIVNGIFCETDKVWISTLEKGVCVFSLADYTASFLEEANGLANNHAKVTFKDSWGNYWVGTSGGGVSKYAGQYSKKLTQKNGLRGNYIYQVFSDIEKRLWVSTSGGGVSVLDTQTIHYNYKNGFLDQKVKAIYQGADSTIWLGTEGAGLAIYDQDTFLFYSTKNGLSGNWVKDFKPDSAGNMWVATSGGGISKFTKDTVKFLYRIEKITEKNGLPSNRINALEIDHKNRLWYGTQQSGIGYVAADNSIIHFTEKNGLKSNQIRSLHRVDSILWIGTARGLNYILLHQDSLHIAQPQKSESLASQNVYLLQSDAQGHLWVGTEKGVDQVTLRGTAFLEVKHYGADNGFDGVETNTNATTRDAEGNVWFGTVDGLFQFSNNTDIYNAIPPKLSFSSITLNHVLDSANGPILDYNRNRIGLTFIGISQTFPKKVLYRWQLLGLDTAWSAWSAKRSVEFLNLSPGAYVFHVEAINENGVVSKFPLTYTFTVATPYWQKWWFLALLISAVFGFIFTLFKLRINALKRKSAQENERILLENKIIQLQQKALQLQMNPHFIFNTLNSIQALIATQEEDVARHFLTRFSKLMRSILEGSRANHILLADEIEMLTNYLHLEQFCYENQFEFTVKVAPETETELIKIPSMILQPFVENAILHGATKSKNRGVVSIEITALAHKVEVKISDNGPGLPIENAQKDEHKSQGVAITKERLQMMHAVDKPVIYTTLKDENGDAAGLAVLVTLPIL